MRRSLQPAAANQRSSLLRSRSIRLWRRFRAVGAPGIASRQLVKIAINGVAFVDLAHYGASRFCPYEWRRRLIVVANIRRYSALQRVNAREGSSAYSAIRNLGKKPLDSIEPRRARRLMRRVFRNTLHRRRDDLCGVRFGHFSWSPAARPFTIYAFQPALFETSTNRNGMFMRERLQVRPRGISKRASPATGTAN